MIQAIADAVSPTTNSSDQKRRFRCSATLRCSKIPKVYYTCLTALEHQPCATLKQPSSRYSPTLGLPIYRTHPSRCELHRRHTAHSHSRRPTKSALLCLLACLPTMAHVSPSHRGARERRCKVYAGRLGHTLRGTSPPNPPRRYCTCLGGVQHTHFPGSLTTLKQASPLRPFSQSLVVSRMDRAGG